MLIVIIFFILSCTSRAQDEKVLVSYDDLPQKILENNGHSKAAQLTLEASQSRSGYLVRSFLPKVDLVGGGEQFKTGIYGYQAQPFGGAEVNINLFKGGRNYLEEKVREKQVEVSHAEAISTKMDELTKARKLFWAIVYQNELEEVITEASSLNQQSLASARKRFSAGLGTETDQIDFEIQATNLNQDLSRIQLERRINERNLNVLIGSNPDAKIKISDSLPHEHQDSILTESTDLAKHRYITSVSGQGEIASLLGSIEKRWWMPSVDIYGAYELYTFRERSYWSTRDRTDVAVGFKITLQLFDGGNSLAEAQAREREKDAYDLRTSQSLRELSSQFLGTKDQLKLMHELIDGSEKNVMLAQKYLKSSVSEYNRGIKNSPDVIGANLRYIDSLRRLLELKKDYQLAKVDLNLLLAK